MFTSLRSVRLLPRVKPIIRLVQPVANFHTYTPLLKAKKSLSKKKTKDEPLEVQPELSEFIDFAEAKKRFQTVVDDFTKVANEAKLGKSDVALFDKLTISTNDGDVPFTSVAQTAIKGRKFFITVFDPDNTQHIINAVLGSDLNMNPQTDPSNKQTLTVPLPPITTETKKESVKQLKLNFEKFKNGTGNKNSSSLSAVRADVKNKVAKLNKKKNLSDAETKLFDDFEKIHKEYIEKLSSVLKSTEQAIMK